MKLITHKIAFSLTLLSFFLSLDIWGDRVLFKIAGMGKYISIEVDFNQETWHSFKQKVEHEIGPCSDIIVFFNSSKYKQENFSDFLAQNLNVNPSLYYELDQNAVLFSSNTNSDTARILDFKDKINTKISIESINDIIQHKLNYFYPMLSAPINQDDIQVDLKGKEFDPDIDGREIRYSLATKKIRLVIQGSEAFMSQLSEDEKTLIFPLTKIHNIEDIKQFISKTFAFDYATKENIQFEPIEYSHKNNPYIDLDDNSEIIAQIDPNQSPSNKYSIKLFDNKGGKNSFTQWFPLNATVRDVITALKLQLEKDGSADRFGIILRDSNNEILANINQKINELNNSFTALVIFNAQILFFCTYKFNPSKPDLLELVGKSSLRIDPQLQPREWLQIIGQQVGLESKIVSEGSNYFSVLLDPEPYFSEIANLKLTEDVRLKYQSQEDQWRSKFLSKITLQDYYCKASKALFDELHSKTRNNLALFPKNKETMTFLINSKGALLRTSDKEAFKALEAQYNDKVNLDTLIEDTLNNISLYPDNIARIDELFRSSKEYINPQPYLDSLQSLHNAFADFKNNQSQKDRADFKKRLQNGWDVFSREREPDLDTVGELAKLGRGLEELLKKIDIKDFDEPTQQSFHDFKEFLDASIKEHLNRAFDIQK